MKFQAQIKICASAFVLIAAALAAPLAQAQQQIEIVFTSLADFDKCATRNRYDTNSCMDALEAYAKKNPQEQFAIGKRVRLHYVHRAALRFFEPAMQKPTPAQCADDDVRMAVISGFNTPPDYDDNKRATKIFGGICFEALRPAIEKEVISSGAESYIYKTACPVMAAKQVSPQSCTAPVAAAKPQVKPEPEKLPVLDVSKAVVNLIKVYKGTEGERVSMADVKDMPGVYLIRVDGVRSAINGKTFVHKEEVSGRNTIYWTEHDSKRWNTVIIQSRSGYNDYSINLPGQRDSLRVSYSDAESKAAKIESLR